MGATTLVVDLAKALEDVKLIVEMCNVLWPATESTKVTFVAFLRTSEV